MHRGTTKELQFADRHVGLLRSSDPQEELSLHAREVGRQDKGIVALGQLSLQGDGPTLGAIGFLGKLTLQVISFPKSYNDGKCVYTKKRLFVGIYLFISQIIGMM